MSTEGIMNKLKGWIGGLTAILLLASVGRVEALAFGDLFAFPDRRPGSAQHLLFDKGPRLFVGAFVVLGSDQDGNPIPLMRATATNLRTGVQYDLPAGTVSFFDFFVQAWPEPEFDTDLHLGTWFFEAWDVELNHASAQMDMEYGFVMPFVKEFSASADESNITFGWRYPKDQEETCTLYGSRVRLLRNVDDQPVATALLFPGQPVNISLDQVPEDLENLWARVENFCLAPALSRSNTFRPLLDLLNE
jgi:hypothetical protein